MSGSRPSSVSSEASVGRGVDSSNSTLQEQQPAIIASAQEKDIPTTSPSNDSHYRPGPPIAGNEPPDSQEDPRPGPYPNPNPDPDPDLLSSSDTNTNPDPDLDPEASLTRLPSGPAYTVFPPSTRKWIVTMITFAGFISPMTANIYFPVLDAVATDLSVSISKANLTLTTYMIMQAFSPTLYGDFGNAAGRRPAFIISFLVYIAANLGLALLQKNYAALLVLRMVQSFGSSGSLALCYAVVADVAVSAERGKYMGFVSAGTNVGPSLSPVIGGLIGQYLGWHAIFWFCLIYTGVWLVPYVLLVPETCRNVVGNGSVKPQAWWNMTKARKTARPKLRFPNPFNTLRVVFNPDLGLLISYGTIVYLVFILICVTLGTQFADRYGYDQLETGLCYLPYGIGCTVAAVVQGRILDWNYRRLAKKTGMTIDYKRGDDLSKFPIEKARLQPVIPILGVATIGYAWALETTTHVAGPLVLLFVVGLCVTGSFSLVNTLVVDLYPEAPATAVAATNLVRCLCGAGATAFIDAMLQMMGVGWTFTFWPLVVVVGPGRQPALPIIINKESNN
ncbi:LOW QUALITY PROTEIN: major facilitator superfamily domain-containing protein [Neurospora tetraspora]|uniref:Major facilitator superfamily domain-containing protein n=1 Tax=Neurospora tetraspora TaxID=94610 RepID=A0AAE0J9W7_9PEZI|nr:LOW QUALITY PROTEIN: major facilitator superfamily domain-containing protein [Neurospora tetraspora]